MICDTLEHLGRYRGLHKNLDTALDFLARQDLSALPMGTTPVDGEEVYVMRMEAKLHPAGGHLSGIPSHLCGSAAGSHRRRGLGLCQRAGG